MTLCLAAICPMLDAIVMVSDTMLSDDYASVELGAIKAQTISLRGRWMCLFADQPSEFTAVMRRLANLLKDVDGVSQDDVMSAVEQVYSELIRKRIESEVLSPLRMTHDEFIDRGLDKLGPDLFSQKLLEVSAAELALELLVVGFDADRFPHLISVNNRGACSELDLVGFHAIGSGEWAALHTLNSRPEFRFGKSVEHVINDMCEAKFAAQTTRSVGETTVVFVLHSDGRLRAIGGPALHRLHYQWRVRTARRKPTPSALVLIQRGLKDLGS